MHASSWHGLPASLLEGIYNWQSTELVMIANITGLVGCTDSTDH